MGWLQGLNELTPSEQYTAAAKTSSLESTSKSLAALSDVFKKDLKLPGMLSAPTLTPGDKSQIIQELQRHMGGMDKGDIVKNFLTTLAANNRLAILESVCANFATLMSAAKGEMDLVITSAQVRYSVYVVGQHLSSPWRQRLDQKTLQRLETAVSKSEYSQGKRLKVVSKVRLPLRICIEGH